MCVVKHDSDVFVGEQRRESFVHAGGCWFSLFALLYSDLVAYWLPTSDGSNVLYIATGGRPDRNDDAALATP